MEELPWGQLFTAIAALGGAAIGSWGTSWGALRRDNEKRIADAKQARDDARHAALLVLARNLVAISSELTSRDRKLCEDARIAFVATLSPGEGAVAAYARDLIQRLMGEPDYRERIKIAAAGSDHMFAWLRGDVKIG